MQHLFYKLSALFIMLMCVSANVQAEIVHHTVCEPTSSSRGFTVECWEDTELNKFYYDANRAKEIVGAALINAVTYAKLPENPVTGNNKFDVIEQDHLNKGDGGIAEELYLNWSASTYIDRSHGDINNNVTRYADFTVKEYKGGNARMVWYRNNPQLDYGRYYVEISVNGTVVYSKNNDDAYQGVFLISLPDLKRNDVVRFAVKQTGASKWEGGPTFKASLEYNIPPCSHEYPTGSAICSICDYVKDHNHTYNNGICTQCGAHDPVYFTVHHEVCEPTLETRGFTVECWENTDTHKFYYDANRTQELVDFALAKAVIYKKLPENPVTETNKFNVIEQDHLNKGDGGIAEELDLNWAVSTVINRSDGDNYYKVTRYADFTVKEYKGGNARMVWYRNNPQVNYGRYYVEISVNGTVVYSKDNNEDYQGVFVVTLPDLKRNDVVRFAVKQTGVGDWAGGPTYKASLEYNILPCSHVYPEGSAFCSICGYMKEHDHTYNETEICSQCGYTDPEYIVMSGYVGKGNAEDIKWELNKYNVLTYTGTGEMESFNKDHNAWKNDYKDLVKKVVIGEGIKKIGDGQSSLSAGEYSYFGGMARLTQIVLPSTLKAIGNNAFEYSQAFASITLPEGLESIGNNAFLGCEGLRTIVIPASVKTIGVSAFKEARFLNTVTLNGAPTTIGSNAFSVLIRLNDFYLMSPNPVSVANDVFITDDMGNMDNLKNATLHVNNNQYEWVKTTSPWSSFKTTVPLKEFNILYNDTEDNAHEKYFDIEASDNTWTLTDGAFKNLTIKEDIPMQKLYYTRNFPKANQWQALYVPFEMRPSDWAEKFDVAAISNFHEYINENGETEMVELEARYVKNNKLLPNIPYLIRAKEAGEQTIVLNNVTLNKTEVQSISCSSTERRYTFTGTYDAINGLQSKDYIFASGGSLCKADNDTDVLKAMRWYITIEDRESMTYNPPTPLAKSINIRLIGEDEATGIEDIRVVSTPVDAKASSIYSVTGVKLANPHKGINIINGKKVFVK